MSKKRISEVWTDAEIAYLRSKGVAPSKITPAELDKRVGFGEFDDLEAFLDDWYKRRESGPALK